MTAAANNMAMDLTLASDAFEAKFGVFRRNLETAKGIQGPLRIVDGAVAACEDALFPRLIERPIHAPVFVTGQFRSGTTLLERIVAQHPTMGHFTYLSSVFPRSPFFAGMMHKVVPGFAAAMVPPHQPNMVVHADWPFEFELLWRFCRNNPWSEHASNVLDASYSDPPFEKLLTRTINKQLAHQRARRLVHKNPLNTIRVGFLGRLFPDAKFVHVVRHPYRVLRSQLDMKRMFERLLAEDSGFDYGATFANLFLPPARCYMRTADDANIRASWQRDPALGMAHSMVDVENTFEQLVRDGGLEQRVLRLRYEDLLGDFRGEMRRIFSFVGLDDESGERIIDAAHHDLLDGTLISNTTPLPQPTPQVREALGPLLEKHGYEGPTRLSSRAAFASPLDHRPAAIIEG